MADSLQSYVQGIRRQCEHVHTALYQTYISYATENGDYLMSADIQYVIRHTSRFTYSAPISESMMEVRMQPRGDERQRCLRFELTTQPRARVFAYQDSLGNVVHHFDIPSRHSRLWITADAIVDMAPHAVQFQTACPTRRGTRSMRWRHRASTGIALQPSHFAHETPLLVELADELAMAARRGSADADASAHLGALPHLHVCAERDPRRFADRRCAEGARGRVSGSRAHHDRARAAHRHPVPIRQRISVARAPKR